MHGVEHRHGSTSGFTRKIGAGVGIGVAPFGFRVSATTTVRFWIDWTVEVDPQELYVRCADEPGCRKVVRADIYRDYRVRSLLDTVLLIWDAGIGHSHRITTRLGTVYLPTPCAKPCCPPEGAEIEFVDLADIPNDLPERPEENLPEEGVEVPWEIPTGPDPFDFEEEGEGH